MPLDSHPNSTIPPCFLPSAADSRVPTSSALVSPDPPAWRGAREGAGGERGRHQVPGRAPRLLHRQGQPDTAAGPRGQDVPPGRDTPPPNLIESTRDYAVRSDAEPLSLLPLSHRSAWRGSTTSAWTGPTTPSASGASCARYVYHTWLRSYDLAESDPAFPSPCCLLIRLPVPRAA